jgi:hypothetical protein
MRNRDRAIFGGAWALMLAGIAAILILAVHPMSFGACAAPSAPNGTTVSVDAQGNASAPYTGGYGLKCSNGAWVKR